MNRFLKTRKHMDAYKVYMSINFFFELFTTVVFSVNSLYQVNFAKLNPLQLVLVGTVLETTVFIFEVPTGVVADRKSRRLSIIIGYLMIGAGFIVEGSFPSFPFILFAQVIWGIGYTFTSGAIQAWITDEIGEENAGKAFMKGAQFGNIGHFIALPIGVSVGLVSLNLPVIFGGVAIFLLGIVLIIIMPENNYTPAPGNTDQSKNSIIDTVREIKTLTKLRPMLVYLLLIGLFYGLYGEGLDRLYTKYFMDSFNIGALSIKPVVFFGILSGIKMILNISVLEILNRKSDTSRSTVFKILISATVLLIIMFLTFGLTDSLVIAVTVFMVIGVGRDIISVFMDIWLNSLIDNPNTRATMFSVRGQVDSIGQIGGGPVLGLVAKIFSIRTALVVSAVILSPILLFYKKVISCHSQHSCNQ